MSQLLAPMRDDFERLFFATFSGKKNKKFLEEIQVFIMYIITHYNTVGMLIIIRSVNSQSTK